MSRMKMIRHATVGKSAPTVARTHGREVNFR